ncbi:MAG TPA: PKD domain-containing protein [Roseiflexaceae bacterium]|nr:PKD domain-containing protein [Roseiflexaceae bacterium]
MRKILTGALLAATLTLGACGSTPTTVDDAANQAGTAIADPTTSAAIDEATTAVLEPTTAAAIDEAANQAGTAIADPTNAAAIDDAANQAATAVSGPDAATAVADATSALSAVADDTTIQQGEALILDATKSAGNISDYKWTIEKAPTGAEAVIGQTIKEGSSGNVSLMPDDYLKYFPQAGPYTVRLTVTDTAGKTATDDFEIVVP